MNDRWSPEQSTPSEQLREENEQSGDKPSEKIREDSSESDVESDDILPVSPGYVRFYRGEIIGTPRIPMSAIDMGALGDIGRYFTTSLEVAKEHAAGLDSAVFYVDVPEKEVKELLTGKEEYIQGNKTYSQLSTDSYVPSGSRKATSSGDITGTLPREYTYHLRKVPGIGPS